MKQDEVDQIPLEEAQERWFSELQFHGAVRKKSSQTIAVEKSVGRITAAPICAVISAPFYYSAACDGISVKSADTLAASLRTPLRLKIGRDAYFVDTGSAVPVGCDTVMSIRDIQVQSLKEIVLERPVSPWRNIRPIGEDMAARDTIIGENRIISPFDVGALIAGGVPEVPVRKKPRVGIIPIGSNLIAPGTPPEVGKSIDYKSHIVLQFVENTHGEGKILPIIAERIEDIKAVIRKGFDRFDLLILICGPSWGTQLLKKLFVEMGELIVGSISMHPGESTCLGILDEKPVVALPDVPMSLFLGFKLFAQPLINRMLGLNAPCHHTIEAFLGRQINSLKGIDEFYRINVGDVAGRNVALPVSRSAAELMSLVRADGMLRVPPSHDRLRVGQKITLELLPSLRDARNTALMTGTYDICIDILKNLLEKKTQGVTLHSSNTGSIEGLRILKQRLAHFSGIHVFDEETGTFNIATVRKHLHSLPLVLINLFRRKIGFLVRGGNPKNITSLNDLTRKDVTVVNRQRGSGTRTIMEYQLSRNSIPPQALNVYKSEARTHISLASIIASGLADTGIGILPAAKALNLDFIPLFLENFDIVIPRRHLNDFSLQAILDLIASEDFKNEVEVMGGYDLSFAGQITYEQGGPAQRDGITLTKRI